MIGGALRGLISLALEVVTLIVIAYAIMSWIPTINRANPLVRLINSIGEAVCEPIRKLIPPRMTGNIDLSPIIVILVVNTLQRLL